jgi:hypothetical protein
MHGHHQMPPPAPVQVIYITNNNYTPSFPDPRNSTMIEEVDESDLNDSDTDIS